MAVKIGIKAKVFWKVGAGSFAELTAARDSTISISVTEIDVTNRGSGGWRLMEPGLKEAELTIEGTWDAADAGCNALIDALIAGTLINIEAIEDTGGEGLIASMKVFSFERTEPLDDVQGFTATLKPAPGVAAPTWGPRST
jgi:predicted secreted protein